MKEKAIRKALTNIKAILLNSYNTGIPESSIDLVILIDAIQSIKDTDALCHEIHQLLKTGSWLFMDAGHLTIPRARDFALSSGFFTMAKQEERNMLLTKKT